MRTFSKLKALCSYPEELDKLSGPKPRRDAAAELGRQFHKYTEEMRRCQIEGRPFHCDGATEPVRTWLRRLRETWTPPDGLECEVPLGLADQDSPSYVEVVEDPPESHDYKPVDGKALLLTAGRADWIWPSADGVVNVCDIKTGQYYLGPPQEIRQLLAQGIAATLRAGARGFVPGIYYARTASFDWGPWIYRDSLAWEDAWDSVYYAAKAPAEPNPGGWCLSCWSKAHCSANPVQP